MDLDPGLGVFDPAINALSILTRILPTPVEVRTATLSFPAIRDAPISAVLTMASDVAPVIDADLSFDQRGPQIWSIAIDTDDGVAVLSDGGARLRINGAKITLTSVSEYNRLYRRFAALIESSSVDADLAPLQLVADCFLLARRRIVPNFDWASLTSGQWLR